MTLPINGKEVLGSLQRVIPNAENFYAHPPSALSSESLRQLLKIHTGDWIIANSDSGSSNFLYTFDENTDQEKVFRIDNNKAFYVFGEDELRAGYIAPWFANKYESYYSQLWEDYQEEKIALDFNEAYNFGIFISELPEEMFLAILDQAIKFSFSHASGFQKKFTTIAEYKKALIKRKHDLPSDLKRFYEQLAQGREIRLFSSKESRELLIGQIYNTLTKDNKGLKGILIGLAQKERKRQAEIKVIYSQKAWRVMKRFIAESKLKFTEEYGKALKAVKSDVAHKSFHEFLNEKFISDFERIITELKAISYDTEYERQAIEMYIQQLQSIKQDKKNITSIQRIVIPIIEEKHEKAQPEQ